jgi:flagellar biosynthesis protein FlhF
MQRKSFFSHTVEAGLAQARREMGDEALLVMSRRTAEDERHLGGYEVVVEAPAGEPAAAAGGAEEVPAIRSELASLRAEVQRVHRALLRAPGLELPRGVPEAVAREAAVLASADVDQELIWELASHASNAVAGACDPLGGFMDSVAQLIRTEHLSGGGTAGRRVIALVGPPGAGKTSTLAKLAVRHTLASRRPPLLISLDTQRVAASERLAAFASILNAPYVRAESTAAVRDALETQRSRELVLVDTPGIACRETDLLQELARGLKQIPEIEVHLVLSADSRTADLRAAAGRWAGLKPSRLIFTRLDETSSYGGIYTVAAMTALPVAFLSAGQSIPEDLEPATRSRILELLFSSPGRSRAAVA